jgi:hypothetical protein
MLNKTIYQLLCGLVLFSVCKADAQGEGVSLQQKSISEWINDCRSNIGRNPTDGQRFCRQALLQISTNPLPEQYRREKLEALTLLGESYFYNGRITDAATYCDSVSVMEGIDQDSPMYRRSKQVQDQIDRYFRPLRIRIKNRQIPILSYIQGIDIEFRYPKRLENFQIKRLQILQDARARKEGEFQFVGISADGHAYMEIDNFPLITYSGRSVGYALIVDGKRRYRFNFTPEDSKTLEIYWDDESEWQLVERIPVGMVKVELPGKYEFTPNGLPLGASYMSTELDGVHHVYIPAETDVEMELLDSEDSTWEKMYQTFLYGTASIAIVVGLFGAR